MLFLQGNTCLSTRTQSLPEIQRESDLLKRQKKEREKRGRRREKKKQKSEKLFLARYVRSCVKVMHGVGVGHDWVKPWVGAAHR
jgi:hypothetical protein